MSAAQVLPLDWELDEADRGADVLQMVERRFETSIIDRLLRLGFDKAELSAVVIPARTLQHRRSRKERLTVEESDKVIRLLRVLRLAEEVYGSRERVLEWLRKPNANLDPALRNVLFAQGGRVPMTLLNTETGARSVEQLLYQISEGVFI
jgi:putative toxin-antitoxin system antitoxin component (TIGR02293 family)